MDPVFNPLPVPEQQSPAVSVPDADADAATTANLTPDQAYAHKHPPYAEMITAALLALNEPNGSTKRAISKYIGEHYSDLPSTHEALLTHHLKRLKFNGQLLMVKYSYMLPRSAPPPPAAPVNGSVNTVTPDPASAGSKRRPGRPPKAKPDVAQVAVPVFQPPTNTNSMPIDTPVAELRPDVAADPVNGAAAVAVKPMRGRGRPPKLHGLTRSLGRPLKAGGTSSSGGVGRGRGRPRLTAPLAHVRKETGAQRGRPPKSINVVQAAVGATNGGLPSVVPSEVGVGVPDAVSGGAGPVKRGRGRPPKAGGVAKRVRNMSAVRPKKPRKLSGKPLGRPRKNASPGVVNRAPDSQLLVAYLDLKAKLERLQSRVSVTANFIKPSLNNGAAINALEELELIAASTTMLAPSSQNQAPQPQPQPQTPVPLEQYHQN